MADKRIKEVEVRVLINLIDDYQSDGCQWKIDGVDLTELKETLKKLRERRFPSKRKQGMRKKVRKGTTNEPR